MVKGEKDNQIVLCGKVVKEKLYPDLYRFAKNNVKSTEEMILNMVKKEQEQGNKKFDVDSAIIILDSDINY